MSLIRKSETLIGVCCASTLLDLDESTLRKGQAGTESLTQIRHGNGKRQRVSFHSRRSCFFENRMDRSGAEQNEQKCFEAGFVMNCEICGTLLRKRQKKFALENVRANIFPNFTEAKANRFTFKFA